MAQQPNALVSRVIIPPTLVRLTALPLPWALVLNLTTALGGNFAFPLVTIPVYAVGTVAALVITFDQALLSPLLIGCLLNVTPRTFWWRYIRREACSSGTGGGATKTGQLRLQPCPTL